LRKGATAPCPWPKPAPCTLSLLGSCLFQAERPLSATTSSAGSSKSPAWSLLGASLDGDWQLVQRFAFLLSVKVAVIVPLSLAPASYEARRIPELRRVRRRRLTAGYRGNNSWHQTRAGGRRPRLRTVTILPWEVTRRHPGYAGP